VKCTIGTRRRRWRRGGQYAYNEHANSAAAILRDGSADAGSHLSGDCVVRFIASTDGTPVVSGRAAVVKQVGEYLNGNTIEFIVKDTWASGPMVVNRRVDWIVSKNGSPWRWCSPSEPGCGRATGRRFSGRQGRGIRTSGAFPWSGASRAM
jgi:hypothetical protein